MSDAVRTVRALRVDDEDIPISGGTLTVRETQPPLQWSLSVGWTRARPSSGEHALAITTSDGVVRIGTARVEGVVDASTGALVRYTGTGRIDPS